MLQLSSENSNTYNQNMLRSESREQTQLHLVFFIYCLIIIFTNQNCQISFKSDICAHFCFFVKGFMG